MFSFNSSFQIISFFFFQRFKQIVSLFFFFGLIGQSDLIDGEKRRFTEIVARDRERGNETKRFV